ncbi:MAG: sigma-54 dependent transcriptional regulator [Desulfobacterota bacterium]|nr:sigma-54 dependent transcriptional regulator [Thermodesulfobacteriota bacterium]
MAQKKKILVIDDEENMRHFLSALLTKEGYTVMTAGDGEEALGLLAEHEVDLILCDLRMPGMDGLAFLEAALQRGITAPIITMSAYGTIDLALETMQRGAYDYISKPFKPPEILLTLKKAEERERLRRENMMLRREVQTRYGFDNIVGTSTALTTVLETVKKIAPFKSSVLITGESGTGKELIARALHCASPRRDKTFLAVNCGAIPETLLESELFGHRKGAFTGAIRDRRGLFEEADEGTLFLDEIGDLPLNLQVKLLRVLQESEIRRVGDDHAIPVDVRVIAATSKHLDQETAQGRFREDLYYRLNVLPLHIPPLRERTEDIPLLIDHFIKKYSAVHGLHCTGVTPEALQAIMAYGWPGNVRELENVIERALILSETGCIDIAVLPEHITSPRALLDPCNEPFSLKQQTRMLEERLIRAALQKTNGNKSKAAKLLEISYPSLLSKIAEYGIEVPQT